MDINDAPTLNSLNKPQKRALIMRDQLRFDEQHHLDSFIEGLSYNEPPAYKRINGTIYPPLVMATLKDTATRFDLGNVHFESDVILPNGIYRAYLTVENGRFEIRTEDALPEDEDNLDSVPIHVFIAKNMVPMFETKFKAIYARMKQINEVRQAAFHSVQKPVEQFLAGETLARLDPDQSAQNVFSSQVTTSKKRRPGEAVNKHTSNKRKRIGLDTIPQDAKTATFDTIPEKIKIDLFDNVIKTALPNFDNLMMASWNVVSVYSNVGTDFPELHKSIVELKSVLQDFEDGFGSKRARKELPMRRDLAPPPRDGAGGTDDANGFGGSNVATGRLLIESAPEPIQDGANDAVAPQDDADNTAQQDANNDDLYDEPELAATGAQRDDMPPPNLMQMIKRHDDAGEQDSENDNDNDNDNDDTEPLPAPRASSTATRRASIFRSTPEQHTRRVTESPLFERENPTPSPELIRRRTDYTSSISTKPPKPKLRHNFPSISISKLKPEPKLRHTLAGAVQPPSTSSSTHTSPTPTSSPAPPTKKRSLAEISTSDLRAAYKKRKAELIATFDGNHNVPQQYRVQMQKMMAEIKGREKLEAEEDDEGEDEDGSEGGLGVRNGGGGKGGGGGGVLGKSVLGVKKRSGNGDGGNGGMGSAPVAPMMHVRKEGGAGGRRLG
ncbi:hypothetical protein CC86DRAFT_457440 [Ophiobolus disseminans]|uniref:Uncharacterized protein n=1 Tax=Ophiobolus disseminans TaxID=1469910 RepID=A0A6A6ZSN2_9PLEO|nr:hypothetical protein CC86DRAFT_457440 [Ophiobolus disseminans]